jgi:hydroxymethylpyrimidine/phosphomethylpyrimidine kinase
LSPEAVVAQMQAVTSDITVKAVKTGMLLNQGIIEAVSTLVSQLPQTIPVVVDPVMVSRAGAQLIDDAAVATLTESLIPQAAIVTPNRYEAELLTGLTLTTLADMEAAARQIYDLGPKAVLVKGGGMADDLKGTDVWFDGQTLKVLITEVVYTPNTHGTGCTLSAAIAANLALGQTPLAAVESAKQYVTNALHHSLTIGQGQGPVGHFYPLLT